MTVQDDATTDVNTTVLMAIADALISELWMNNFQKKPNYSLVLFYFFIFFIFIIVLHFQIFWLLFWLLLLLCVFLSISSNEKLLSETKKIHKNFKLQLQILMPKWRHYMNIIILQIILIKNLLYRRHLNVSSKLLDVKFLTFHTLANKKTCWTVSLLNRNYAS